MIPAKCFELTMEQQFKLRMLDADIDRLSAEQAREIIRDWVKQIEIKDNIIKHLMIQNLFD
jgi:hypothetical protein